MIRINARYRLTTDDFAVADQVSDALMDALMTVEGVTDQDVAVSMTDQILEVWLGVPTDDVSVAFVLGSRALAEGFAKAGFTAPSTDMHADLVLAS